jgi:hypothetical protein
MPQTAMQAELFRSPKSAASSEGFGKTHYLVGVRATDPDDATVKRLYLRWDP